MENQWSLDTHGDPLGTVQNFISNIWSEAPLDGMLVTLGREPADALPRYVTEKELLNTVNPFKPLMEVNSARLIPGLLASHPQAKVGALLRPCEMRALIQISKHAALDTSSLITISVDCLGTLPADEYQWRLERMEASSSPEQPDSTETTDELASEALKFARQGGIIPYRYRSACQVCSSPAASQAMVNIHVLGLPVRQHLLVSFANPELERSMQDKNLLAGNASPELIQQNEHLLSKMKERHARSMARLDESLSTLLPSDVDALIQQLESCGDCQDCMDACPICSIIQPTQASDGHYERSDVMRWLTSCAGCGMCEQACPSHLPLAAIFTHIRKQLLQEVQPI